MQLVFNLKSVKIALLGLLVSFPLISANSSYVRNSKHNTSVIVFVHGILGNSIDTWTNTKSKAYWPDLLKSDSRFDNYNIYVYNYPSTFKKGNFSIDEISEDMRNQLNIDNVNTHNHIIFLAHSMGGLVVRSYLLKYREIAPKIELIYFFATPTTGSPFATLGSIVSKNPQFGNMQSISDPDSALGPLQTAWLAANFKFPSYCGYETIPVFGNNIVVSRESATNLCNRRLDPIQEDHINIVKPIDKTSKSYLAFLGAVIESQQTPLGLTAELRNSSNPSIIKLFISNQESKIFEVSNLCLNWRYYKCEQIEIMKIKRSQINSDQVSPLEIINFSTHVQVVDKNGFSKLLHFDSSQSSYRGGRPIDLFKYANGDIDSFWIFLEKMPENFVGQTYDFWITFNYRVPGDEVYKPFSSNKVTVGSCTKVVIETD
jgi:pimeloyl-ACP methyl ester carboxylesterase